MTWEECFDTFAVQEDWASVNRYLQEIAGDSEMSEEETDKAIDAFLTAFPMFRALEPRALCTACTIYTIKNPQPMEEVMRLSVYEMRTEPEDPRVNVGPHNIPVRDS